MNVMKALRVDGQRISLEDIPKPERNGEAFVRVIKSGICNTDLEIVRGYAGFNGTIGHEFVGVVEASEERPELTGRRVVGEINVGCGNCDLCRAGDSRHCAGRSVLGIHGRDGAHAEFLTLPSQNLIEVPDNVSNNSAVFAEPLAAAYGIFERVDIDRATKVAIVGDGKLGLLCAMTMRLRADSVLLVGKHREKLKIGEKFGVETALAEKIQERTRSFDVVVEASGSASGFSAASGLVKPRGQIVLKSTFHGFIEWESSRFVVDELSIVGSRCGRLAPAIDLLASNRISVE
ncbi:MAG TPA: alcohol dehydrogenase catalytic domain-containing protein, partial [Pyrinomonadaceae bacterium]